VRTSEHALDAMPSFAIWRVVHLFLYDGTTEPLPYTGLTVPQDQQDCLSFQAYAVLTLIVKRAVQATDIQVDARYRCGLYHSNLRFEGIPVVNQMMLAELNNRPSLYVVDFSSTVCLEEQRQR
jgi:hypothetical protein